MTQPTKVQIDVCLEQLERNELDLDAKVKARTVIYERQYPGFEVTGAVLRRLFFWGVLLCVAIWWVWPSR
jgi:hypothetical protein